MSASNDGIQRDRLGELGSRLFTLCAGVGVVALLVSIVLGFMADEPGRFYRSYVFAFFFVTTIMLGGLFFTIVQHATRAGWVVSIRRVAESSIANFAWWGVLFIPVIIALFRTDQYHWMHPDGDAMLEHKSPYLNANFWIIRAIIFLGIWGFLGLFFYRNSVAQDETGDVSLTMRMQRLAPIAIIMFAISVTFASVDWVMSLEAHWFSTMFGVYVFAASCCGFFSFQILVFYYLRRQGRLINEVTLEHFQEMGKLLFAFGVVFWAYIGFSQFMLIWYANIPEETTWYAPRTLGPWRAVSWFLLIGHFIMPFLLLITKHTKRIPFVLALIAAWTLFMHFVDIYWLVMPQVPAVAMAEASGFRELASGVSAGTIDIGFAPHLLDITLVIGLGGLFLAGFVRALGAGCLYPKGDPRVAESLAFENM